MTNSPSLLHKALTESAIGAFYDAYNALGYGFLEHVYSLALERELLERGHRVCREFQVLIQYKGVELTWQRLDMVVDERLVLEIKSTRKVDPSAPRQLFNYLRASNLEVGLLLHFGPKPGFFRIVSSNPRTDQPHPFNPPHPRPKSAVLTRSS